MRKVGILTGGGDCPGTNAVIHAATSVLSSYGFETLGFKRSFEGVIAGDFHRLTPDFTFEKAFSGGAFLKTKNKGSFTARNGDGSINILDPKVISDFMDAYRKHDLDGIISIGGDGTAAGLWQLMAAGAKFIAVPKSIDNDLSLTDRTFGFKTASSLSAEAVLALRNTGDSHDRVMVLEVMGRNSGFIALEAGICSFADVILIPEIKYDKDIIMKKIKSVVATGRYPVIIVAEGAISGEDMKNDVEAAGYECRHLVLGHVARGTKPISEDVGFGAKLGAFAGTLAVNGKWNRMAASRGNTLASIAITEQILDVRKLNIGSQDIFLAKSMGISFGDAEPAASTVSGEYLFSLEDGAVANARGTLLKNGSIELFAGSYTRTPNQEILARLFKEDFRKDGSAIVLVRNVRFPSPSEASDFLSDKKNVGRDKWISTTTGLRMEKKFEKKKEANDQSDDDKVQTVVVQQPTPVADLVQAQDAVKVDDVVKSVPAIPPVVSSETKPVPGVNSDIISPVAPVIQPIQTAQKDEPVSESVSVSVSSPATSPVKDSLGDIADAFDNAKVDTVSVQEASQKVASSNEMDESSIHKLEI